MRVAFISWNRLGVVLLAAWLSGCGPPPNSKISTPRPDDELGDEDLLAGASAAAHAAFVRGTFLKQQGDLSGALQELTEAVHLSPREPGLRLALVALQLETGRGSQARDFLQASIARYGGTPREHELLARLLALAGQSSTALAQVDSALRADSTLVPAWLLRGRLLFEAERFEAALASFRHADTLQPQQAPTLESLGDCSLRLGRSAEAEAAYRGALRLDPELATARESLASLYRGTGRRPDAERLYLEALDENPGDLAPLESLLEMCLEAGEVQRASELLRPYQARQALPPDLVVLYGRILLQEEHLAAADSVLAPLAGVEGVRGVEALLGDIAVRGARPDEARAHYRRAIAQEPGECAPLACLALVDIDSLRDVQGRVQLVGELGEEVRRSLQAGSQRAGPQDYRCNLLLGIAYFDLRQFEAAARHLEISHKLDAKNPQVLFDLAMVEQELGHFEAARRVGEELLKLDPDNAAALNFVGYIVAERGLDLDHSEELIRRALAKEPENGFYVDSLGWVLYQKGDYGRAATQLERAVELTGEHDAAILEHLGDAYIKVGRLDAAFRVYKSAKQIDPENTGLGKKLARVEKDLGKP